MKIKLIKPSHLQGSKKQITMSPPIPLCRTEEVKANQDDLLKFKLYSNPNDKDGASYEIKVKIFRTGTPEEYIKTVIALKKVLRGQDIVTGQEQYAMARRLFDGEALTAFNNASTTIGAETIQHLDEVLKKVAGSVFPLRSYANQKQAMRRFMRKPRELKIREYVERILELNEYLVYFPTKDGEAEATKLPNEEILDILVFGIPNAWQKKMVELGFDSLSHTPNEFIEICERISFGETTENGQNVKTKQIASEKGAKWLPNSSRKNFNNTKQNYKDKFCPLHKMYGHDANDCKVIQAQVKKMASSWESGGYTNYKKQKQELQSKKTEQMFSFFKKAFKEATTETASDKAKPVSNKKRKNEENFAFDEELFDELDLDSNSQNEN
jgi:hypothetical protein